MSCTVVLLTEPPAWNLPAPNCLSVAAEIYFGMTKVPFQRRYVNYGYSPVTGQLPGVLWANESATAVETLSFLNEKFCNLEEFRTSRELADLQAYLSMFRHNILPLVDYLLWCNDDNYSAGMVNTYARNAPFPVNMISRESRRRDIKAYFNSLDVGHRISNVSELVAKARPTLDSLHHKLQESADIYFYGRSPSSLDCLVAGTLAVVDNAAIANNPLKTFIQNEYPDLITHYQRILITFVPGLYTTEHKVEAIPCDEGIQTPPIKSPSPRSIRVKLDTEDGKSKSKEEEGRSGKLTRAEKAREKLKNQMFITSAILSLGACVWYYKKRTTI